jgi:tripartite ATP-independent transporter DctM subunit
VFILLFSLAVFLLLGIPIAYSLGLSAFCYFISVHPELLSVLPQRLYAGMDSYAMIALPLFILMGLVMNAGGITTRLIDFSMLFVGRFHGGLGAVNVVASMIFGGISGSSVSDTASMGAVLIPEMEKKGYTPQFASGVTVASSTMGMIIPPSVPMVIYAMASEESVGKLFLGSLIPGIMIGIMMLAITLGISSWKKYPREEVKLSRKEIYIRIRQSLLAVIMPVFVIGSVVLGIVTATESAGIGVLYAFVIGFFVIKGLSLKKLPSLLKKSIMTSAHVMIIIALSEIYKWILAIERVPQAVAGFISGLHVPNFIIILLINAVILITGTFVDVSPAILLLTPVFLPAMHILGVNSIQFGVILICGLAIGLVTPPVGMCLNVASAISKQSIGTIFRAAIPFLLANIITLLLISFIPQLSLWLPSLFMK